MEITPIITKDFLMFSDDETFSSVIGKLKNFEKRSGLVFKNNKYLGLIERKRLLRTKIDVTKAKIKSFVQPTPILNEHADIIESAYLMYLSNMQFLPVEREKKIYGVLNAIDLAKLGSELPEMKKAKVSDIKLIKTKSISKDDPISMVIEIMFKEKIDQVPIFEKGKLYGIVSYRDLIKKYLNWSPKREFSTKFNKEASTRSAESDTPNLANLPVSTFSTNDNLFTITKDNSLIEATSLMANKNISNLIVVSSEGVEGILGVKNILRKIGSLKIPKNFNIKFVGLKEADLKPHQTFNLKKIASNEAFKLQRQLRNEVFDLVIHLKLYHKDSNKQKYSINMRLEFPSEIVTSSESDWNFETALRKSFNNAKNKLKKKFKGDSSHRKGYE
ncbi:MAG: CBS domain-containing protein [Nanoarchaeota archaeon]|nr:CBS domain-containing protein [Nanoarchaeota archaeon]MBU1643772.1 CBS domain-containing protein [Nanoarchaeota archaeon]MBU1976389.1 CBS domain-containing protein [Nanoarchaeota archaeon]